MLTALTVLAYWLAASVLVAAGWAAWRELEKRCTGH